MKIEFTFSDVELKIIDRHTANCALYMESIARNTVHTVMQNNGHQPDAEGHYTQAAIDAVLKLPTVAETETARKAQADVQQKEAAQKQAEVDKQKVIDDQAAEQAREQQIKLAAKQLLAEMLADGSVVLRDKVAK
jgi:hypothetical protein